MKISMDIRGAYLYHGTGIGTYTENLISTLLKIDKENTYDLFYCGDKIEKFKTDNSNIHLISKKYSSFFEEKYIPYILDKENISLFHIPQNGIGYKSINNNKIKTIVTIHDLIPYVLPETVGKSYLKNFLKEMPYIVEQSSSIITVSKYSKDEIIRFFSVDPKKIFVTPLATNSIFKPMNINLCKEFIKTNYHIHDDFILYLGGFSKRKNIYNLILAFEKAYKNFNKEIKLVLLGSIRDEFKILKKIIEEKNMQNKIIFTGFIPENQLPIFYNACLFFTYISYYEGFGLPILEAMSCKKATITSNLTSIPEVCGNSSYYTDPYDIFEISKSLCQLANNDSLRKELENKSLDHSKNFSFEKCANLTLEAYKETFKK